MPFREIFLINFGGAVIVDFVVAVVNVAVVVFKDRRKCIDLTS